MKINTKYLGETDIKQQNIIKFPTGLPGFINETAFVLLNLPGNPVFQILQSITSENIAFIVASPYHFYEDYAFELDDSILESLMLNSDKDVVVLAILTLKEPFNESTINLKAPIIINAAEKRGKQYILNIDDYETKAPITPTKPSVVKGE